MIEIIPRDGGSDVVDVSEGILSFDREDLGSRESLPVEVDRFEEVRKVCSQLGEEWYGIRCDED